MRSHDYYLKKSLAHLHKVDAKLAFKIMRTDPTPLEFCLTEKKEPNLKRTFEGHTYHYHSEKGALDEAQEWFHSIAHETTVIYVYGTGLGYYYDVAKNWLKYHPDRALVFLEEDPAVLHRLFETERGLEMLRNPQVQIVHFTDLLEDKTLFNELSWTYIFCPFTISCLKLYAQVNHEGFSSLHHEITYEAMQKKDIVEEYLNYGIPFFRNFYPNLRELPDSSWGNGLFGQFQEVPAIICGAGPSLDKNIKLLGTLKDRALFFAGSSGLNGLMQEGITPHFGAAIDPNQAQLARVSAVKETKVPFFYRNRIFHDALGAIRGPRLYLSGTGGYEIADWFDQELGLEGPSLDEGHNVINFCLEIARALGCNPIILVGVDLAFTDDQYYSNNVTTNLQLTEKDFEGSGYDAQPILRTDIEGKPIHTLWRWVIEADWISQFAEKNPQLTLLNATEGGLGMKGVSNITLKQVKEEFLISKQDLHTVVEKKIAESGSFPVPLEDGKIRALLGRVHRSLEDCVEKITRLKKEMARLQDIIMKGEKPPTNLETPTSKLLEIEIDEEIGYRYLLETFNLIFTRWRHRTIQRLQDPHRKMSEKSRNKKKIELQMERLGFLTDVALVNMELIKRAII